MKKWKNNISLIIFIVCLSVSCRADCMDVNQSDSDSIHRVTDTIQSEDSTTAERIVFDIQQNNIREIPAGKRVAFEWDVVGMYEGDTIFLTSDQELKGKYGWLRLTVAQEIWDSKKIDASVAGTEIDLGTFDIKYSSVLVPYEIQISNQYFDQIQQNGITLTLENSSSFWFYKTTSPESTGLVSHLLLSDTINGDINCFLDCFLSENSVQAFGWREGTVLDGLWQLYSKNNCEDALLTINKHFDLFFDSDSNLTYENSSSIPKYNSIDGIESTIPFATLARLYPNHSILETVVEGWQSLKKDNGMIIDGTMVSAEGCYTISYPMAVIGKAWDDEELISEAQAQLQYRFVLINNGNFYLRYDTGGQYSYCNWARGAAWFLLGYIRTIEELGVENVADNIIEKYKEAVDIAISMQRESDGLWSCFMDDEDSLPDASGSAGIAAAVMSGINMEILSSEYLENVETCYKSLQDYITPDGFLKGVAQDNRGGESLQRSDYRVIAQMGMGMMAQLYAALYQKEDGLFTKSMKR